MSRPPQAAAVLAAALALSVPAALRAQDGAALQAELAAYPHRLLFETERDGNWELYTCNADGTDPRNLTRTEDIDETYGKVSPDGQWIAFQADTWEGEGEDAHRRRDIGLMRVDGSDRMVLIERGREPFWSPDNSEIGYLPDEFERFSAVTWATKGLRIFSFVTGETRAHPNAALEHLFCPCFSADGKWILASVHGGMGLRHAIVALAADGDTVHDLHLEGCRPDVSADGRTLCWGLTEYTLARAALDLTGETPQVGTAEQIVRNAPRRDDMIYHADLSPDARFVAFTSGPRDGRRRLGSHRTPESSGVEAEGWDLWVARAEAPHERMRITAGGRSNKEPDWIPVPIARTEKDDTAGDGKHAEGAGR
ncbi:MAG: TolB family protein [Planctomycetota bacterium]